MRGRLPSGLPPGRRVDRELIVQTAREHPDWSYTQIADLVGCSRAAVSKWLKIDRQGNPAPTSGQWPCPLCGLPLIHGSHHFVVMHGMTAAEVRKATGRRTTDPRTGRMLRRELEEQAGLVVWTDGAILSALRAHYRTTGNAPGFAQWARRTRARPASTTVVERFNSWNNALDTAGIPRHRPRPFRQTQRWKAARNAARGRRLSEWVATTCPVCGTRTERPPSEVRKRSTSCCSRSCVQKLRRVVRPLVACPTCGERFCPRRRQVYCSRPCRPHPARVDKITRSCPRCGRTFERFPSQVTVYCSWRCTYPPRTCPTCGRSFYGRKRTQRHCSRGCVLSRRAVPVSDDGGACGRTARP